LLYNKYKDNLSLMKQQIESLRQIRNHIVTSTSKDNIVYLKGKTTIYDILVALKKRLAPTDNARKIEVATKYSKLRVFDKKTDLEA
jgi:transketolase N-terminal domain/subunit